MKPTLWISAKVIREEVHVYVTNLFKIDFIYRDVKKMAKKNLFVLLEGLIIVISGYSLIMGLWQPGNLGLQLAGIITSFVGLAISVFVTWLTSGEEEVDDVSLLNSLIYPLIVGDALTIGSWFDAEPIVQSIFLDLGLIMGIFIIFNFIWSLLREKYMFLEIEEIDFFSGVDKSEMPRFLIVSLILGSLYGGLFVIFKVLYHFALGYNWTSYIFMMIVAVLSILLSFLHYILNPSELKPSKEKSKSPKKKEESSKEKASE